MAKRKYLIMLDVDQVLLDTNYQSTSPTINSVFKQMEDEGHVFLLNSNRALEDLEYVTNIFDISAILIGENGAFIHSLKSGDSTIIASEDDINAIAKLNVALREFVDKKFPDNEFVVGDTTDINKNVDIFETSNIGKKFFLLNKFRKYTTSLYVKKIENNEVVIDLESAILIHEFAEDFIRKNNLNLKSTYTKHYGNVLVVPTGFNKVQAFKNVQESYKNNITVIIADDFDDKPLNHEMDYFGVVNNADEEAKEMADYVSPESITKGVEDILLKLDKLTS